MLWTETLGSVLFADVQLFSSAGGSEGGGAARWGRQYGVRHIYQDFLCVKYHWFFQSLNMLCYFKFSHE